MAPSARRRCSLCGAYPEKTCRVPKDTVARTHFFTRLSFSSKTLTTLSKYADEDNDTRICASHLEPFPVLSDQVIFCFNLSRLSFCHTKPPNKQEDDDEAELAPLSPPRTPVTPTPRTLPSRPAPPTDEPSSSLQKRKLEVRDYHSYSDPYERVVSSTDK